MPQTRTTTPRPHDLPSEATEHAMRVHEAAAKLAEDAGFSKDAQAHRELAVRMRRGRRGVVEAGRPG